MGTTEENMSPDRDLISDMPDVILQHILSFLPSRQSARTSVLSRRWLHLWRCVPTLHFDTNDHTTPPNRQEIIEASRELADWINQFLNLRDPASPLLRFHLRIHFEFHHQGNPLQDWLSYAGSHGVRDMALHLPSMAPFGAAARPRLRVRAAASQTQPPLDYSFSGRTREAVAFTGSARRSASHKRVHRVSALTSERSARAKTLAARVKTLATRAKILAAQKLRHSRSPLQRNKTAGKPYRRSRSPLRCLLPPLPPLSSAFRPCSLPSVAICCSLPSTTAFHHCCPLRLKSPLATY